MTANVFSCALEITQMADEKLVLVNFTISASNSQRSSLLITIYFSIFRRAVAYKSVHSVEPPTSIRIQVQVCY